MGSGLSVPESLVIRTLKFCFVTYMPRKELTAAVTYVAGFLMGQKEAITPGRRGPESICAKCYSEKLVYAIKIVKTFKILLFNYQFLFYAVKRIYS